MSRIGLAPIEIPQGVSVRQQDNTVSVKGPRGELTQSFHPNMAITLDDNELRVARPDDERQNRALHGLTRALLANMVVGVTEGFRKQLRINGVGFRGTQDGRALVLQVGYSHPVVVEPPAGITLTVDRGGQLITVEGNDKQLVGEVAAKIRAIRKPEPYKGTGIAYSDEVVRRKAGKAGRSGG
ncbi:MAG: 50S ribosomal protein L6 [Chloroflexi bacterium]|nr:50S ribosomal protein L6 [Chloroflexota bacterium]